MPKHVNSLDAFLTAHPACVLVTVTETKGSVPRERGAFMLVAAADSHGTIGGGHMEYAATDRAREMLAACKKHSALEMNLGPEIGQCCGGYVSLCLELISDLLRSEIVRREQDENAALPDVYVFGAGHVGNALARAFALLPVKVKLVDGRTEALRGAPEGIEKVLSAVPEDIVRTAPSGSAFLVLTHDHALDFLIVREALGRTDAAYVGMIGSKSKRATFRHWYLREGGDVAALARLVSPIGGTKVGDKRPAVIAALAAAEVMTALSSAKAHANASEPVHV